MSKRQHQTETKMRTTNAQDEVRKQDTGTQQEPLQQQPVSQSVSRSRHNRNSRNEASPATPAASVRSQIPRGGETAEGPLDTTQSLRSNRNTQSTLSSKTRGHNDGDYGDVGGVWSVVRHPEVSTAVRGMREVQRESPPSALSLSTPDLLRTAPSMEPHRHPLARGQGHGHGPYAPKAPFWERGGEAEMTG